MNIAREATKRRAHLYCTADIPIECQKVTFQPISGVYPYQKNRMRFRFVERECCVMTPNKPPKLKEIKRVWYFFSNTLSKSTDIAPLLKASEVVSFRTLLRSLFGAT